MRRVIREGVPAAEMPHVLGMERSRIERADKAVIAVVEPGGEVHAPGPPPHQRRAEPRVAIVKSTVWGFDRWYLWAPVVVSFSARLDKVTAGCPDRETAERLFGPGGLANIWPLLGPGWGGRETVGGSPRGERLTLADAERAALRIAEVLAPVRPTGRPQA
jgi:hypothetical protein